MTAPVAAIDRWRRLPVAARMTVGAVALLVAFNMVLAGVDLASGGPAPGGPPSSSYATAPHGLAAYADLLARHGHPVRRLRTTLDAARLDPAGTLVVADPTPLSAHEERAVRRFVEAGGRLVAAGRDVAPLLERVLVRAPVWAPGATTSARPVVPVPEVANVALVRSGGGGSWEEPGASLPVLAGSGSGRGVLATVATVGGGRVVALADASVFHNALLVRADNAAFAVAVAGERGRPVAFAEAVHGYGDADGLGAVPRRWRWALGASVAAVLVWMWSRGRRLGPPEEAARPAPPPRRAYVDAIAASLARTRQPARCVQPLQEAARRRLAARAGLAPDAGEEALRHAARRLGVPPEDVAALFTPPRDDRELLAVGRAVAGVADKEGRRW